MPMARNSEALKVRAPYNFGVCQIGTAMRNCSELGIAALGVEGILKVFFCDPRRLSNYSM